LTFYAGFKCNQELSGWDQIGKPLIQTTILESIKLNDTVYLVSKRWGLTGDHQIYSVTTNMPADENWKPNPTNDLIWSGDNTIYYQQKKDTIIFWSLNPPDSLFELKSRQTILYYQIDNARKDKFKLRSDSAIKIFE